MATTQCKEMMRVRGGFFNQKVQCKAKATCDDGYCGRHSPAKRKVRGDAREEKILEKYRSAAEAREAKRQAEINVAVKAETAELRIQSDELLAALDDLVAMTDEPPEPSCSCHISPPCNDCVEYSGIRSALAAAKKAIAKAKVSA